jgi:hypothetical protein
MKNKGRAAEDVYKEKNTPRLYINSKRLRSEAMKPFGLLVIFKNI